MAGGWEASTLDTAFMYQDGNYGEVGNASITYNVKATTQSKPTTKSKMAKNQSRSTVAFKMESGAFDLGLSSYMSGAIQLSGTNGNASTCNPATLPAACSVVPDADVIMNSLALIGRYKMDDNLSFLAGVNRYEIASGATVSALSGHYAVSGDAIAPTFGAAYERSEIALRAELVIQSKTKISNFKAQSSFAAGGAATTLQDVSDESMTIPQTMKLNFQSGIAENTLMFGSIHQANWDDAQIVIPARDNGSALGGVDAVGSSFASKTTYSIGVGRKFTEQLSGLISYTTEAGGGKTTSDPFTLRNGYQSLSVGGRYTVGNITVSGGYNYTLPGDVDLAHKKADGTASGLTASYKNNNVSAFGLKVGFSF
jgi:long-subunit fatty acid transport protein